MGRAEQRIWERVNYSELLATAYADMVAPRAPDAPTVISTFAGGGGSSMGYAMAGYHELLTTDWNKHACQCLRANGLGDEVIEGDITELSPEKILALTGLEPGDLDVLDGSPPCQGFSSIGKRVVDDERNQLFRHFCRLIDGLQPKVFVMENVTGMVKGEMKLVFAEILKELKSHGYRVFAWVMNAKWFGVPQSRERVIFIGFRSDLGLDPAAPDPTVDVPYSMAEAFGRDEKSMMDRYAIGRCPEGAEAHEMFHPSPTLKCQGIGSGFKQEFGIPVRRKNISHGVKYEDLIHDGPAPTVTRLGMGACNWHQYMIRTAGDGVGSKIPIDRPSPTVAASSISDVWNACAGIVAFDDWGSGDPTAEDYNPALLRPGPPFTGAAIRRLKSSKLKTWTDMSTGERKRLELRTLSTGEVMRLQSFPDQYVWPEKTSWTSAWERIGNSVPPLMMREIARKIRELVFDG